MAKLKCNGHFPWRYCAWSLCTVCHAINDIFAHLESCLLIIHLNVWNVAGCWYSPMDLSSDVDCRKRCNIVRVNEYCSIVTMYTVSMFIVHTVGSELVWWIKIRIRLMKWSWKLVILSKSYTMKYHHYWVSKCVPCCMAFSKSQEEFLLYKR